MSLNSTPNAERIHIGIFGKRNAGKSSLINAITGQDLAVVSEVSGTTTDPVSKAMELLPLGPVLLIDTPGLDDTGELGEKRVHRSLQILNKTDIALLVVDARDGLSAEDHTILTRIRQKQIPCIIVENKQDLLKTEEQTSQQNTEKAATTGEKNSDKKIPEIEGVPAIRVSAATGYHIRELKELIASIYKAPEEKFRIVGDLLSPSDLAVLVVPIDKAAPKGRLILPQQQTIRDILEADATAVVCKEYELRETLESLKRKPKIVITDSQVFAKVSADTPKDILLTSFSILMARYKGSLADAVKGVTALDTLKDGDKVLIGEGCTHHRQCDDIGSVKIPRWIRDYTGVDPEFVYTSGVEFPEDLSPYHMIVHCGGCTLNEREMKYRTACAKDAGIPMTNYGILIAYMQGILKRSVEAFPSIAMLLDRTGK
ncbi:MAG TPA: [FeFe] hydrogenase H-cluster maturation GTPase HydF [Lachnospiraceae bacterium]|nr:[FeFe] hydrogenase H-cluster maturation GTPase HydF [Lachnospiraceae bacterium]